MEAPASRQRKRGLATVDVLLLGANIVAAEATLQALHTAVCEHGVGLLSDGWLGAMHLSGLSATARELMLARPPTYAYHMPDKRGATADTVVRNT